MTSLKLAEPLIDAIILKLKGGMGARVATINAEDTLGIVLTAPRTTGGSSIDGSDYFRGGIEMLAMTPAIMVCEGPTTVLPDTEGPHSMITGTEILVRVVEGDTSRERLSIRLQRQVRAINETLWDDDPRERLDGSAHRISLVRIDPGPVFDPDKTNPWRSYSDVIWLAEQLEG